jgi:hypothetical protein
MRGIARFLAAACAAALLAMPAMSKPEASRALAAFQQLKNLAGTWRGTDEHGRTVRSSFRMIAGNTAVMETLYPPEMEPMVTLYSIDGNTIALMHYCPTNNQPHMRAIPPASGTVRRLEFEFQGAGNLPNLAVGHEQKLVLEFTDKDHIVEHWTWRENGKNSPMVYHLQRQAK